MLALLNGCAGPSDQVRATKPDRPAAGARAIVGQPYQAGGRWHYPADNLDYDRTGAASWYGRELHGRRTASGERFDMNAMTAAHPTLPLPTLVRVTNLANGRSVVLRINDRGPFAANRIIDVSHAAARALGFEAQGATTVRVTVLKAETLRLRQQAAAPGADTTPR
jgi:rare lipoprotein A